ASPYTTVSAVPLRRSASRLPSNAWTPSEPSASRRWRGGPPSASAPHSLEDAARRGLTSRPARRRLDRRLGRLCSRSEEGPQPARGEAHHGDDEDAREYRAQRRVVLDLVFDQVVDGERSH